MEQNRIMRRRLQVIRSQKITVPRSSRVVRIYVINGKPELWLESEQVSESSKERIIELYSTEEKVPDDECMLYIGDFQITDPHFSPDTMEFLCYEYRPDLLSTLEVCDSNEESIVRSRL